MDFVVLRQTAEPVRNAENIQENQTVGLRKRMRRPPCTERRTLRWRSSAGTNGADSEAERRSHHRSFYGHPKVRGYHFSARFHANRGEILSRDHGHRRRLARL